MVYSYKNIDNKEKVLRLFFEHPEKEFHIRQLARLSKLNPNTIINLTNQLLKEGLIIKSESAEKPFASIKANTSYWLYKLKKIENNIGKIYKSGLIEFLNKELSYPTIILFGSYAKAENHENSDIDLFILSEKKERPNLNIYEKKLTATIQIFLHNKKEFNQLKKNSKELINNVINGHKLTGYLEVL